MHDDWPIERLDGLHTDRCGRLAESSLLTEGGHPDYRIGGVIRADARLSSDGLIH
ncbi:MAG: hypothetical protein KDI73_12875 [Candidatus Competibacteraceae bacterium]|nr:hypothetical protein [Candidatus Competibacteraceae bacterium]